MSNSPRRRLWIVVALVVLALLALLLLRCSRKKPETPATAPASSAPASPSPSAPPALPSAAGAVPAAKQPDEVLTPATVKALARVDAGAAFEVAWTGPDNDRDYVTIVRPEAAESEYANFAETRAGNPLKLTAPIEPGEWELRYVAVRSKKVLGRAAITIVPVGATLDAPASVVLGAEISIAWTGPDNEGDYITIVPPGTRDGEYHNFTYTRNGSPLTVTAPADAGPAELRYMTGQGAKVLARRAIRILTPDVTLSAPGEVVAGSTVAVTWSGPNNSGDYITVVPRETRDGLYGNYTYTRQGSPLNVKTPIDAGDAEYRYMTGQGAKVLARRPVKIVAAEISLAAPAEAVAGTAVAVTWTGPNNDGDYLTVVPKSAKDGTYGHYTNTNRGSPLNVTAPAEAGDAEVRYMSGQGAKVLARRAIKILPVE